MSSKQVVYRDTNKSLATRMLEHWQLYVFLLIPVIYLLVFKYYPMLGLQLAFKRFNIRDGVWGSPWIGFDHFVKFFNSYQFKRVITNTITVSLYGLLSGFPLPILLALSMNSITSKRFKKFTQTVTYLPYFISVVVLVGILFQVLAPRGGLIVNLFGGLIKSEFPDLMANPGLFKHLYVWSGNWQYMGYNSIIYVAALAGVDPELHEAAQIDGASRFKRVLHIDFPTILPTASVLLIMSAGRIMTVGFEKVYLMQNPLNISASEVITTYVYKVGLGTATTDFSYGTAIGLFNSLINLILIVLVNQLAKRWGETSLF